MSEGQEDLVFVQVKVELGTESEGFPVRIKREREHSSSEETGSTDAVRVKRERLEEAPAPSQQISFDAPGFKIFENFPAIPITEQHKQLRRARCVCMENVGLAHIMKLLTAVDAAAGALCLPETAAVFERLEKALANDIEPAVLRERLHQLLIEAEEENGGLGYSKKRKKGAGSQMQKLFAIQNKLFTLLRQLQNVIEKTRGDYGRLAERQIVINNKLATIRVTREEGELARTTEYPNWSFLNQKQRNNKFKL